MLTRFRIFSWLLALLALIATPLCGQAMAELTPAEIEYVRELYRDQTRHDLGFVKMLAGLTNMVLSPDLSSAFFKIEDEGDGPGVKLSTTKVPIYHTFKSKEHDWSVFAGVVLSYLRASEDIDTPVEFDDNIERLAANSSWKGYSGNAEAGFNYPLGLGFTLSPSVGFGVAQLRSSADYLNAFGNKDLGPIINGVTTNFYVDTLNYTASLAMSYENTLGPVALLAKVKYSYVYTDAYDSTDDVQMFHESTNLVNGRLELQGPTGLAPWGLPLGWEVFTAQTWFPDLDKDALGFTYYCELGAALAVDIARAGLPIGALKLGGSALAGDNITGWSVILGYSF